MAFSNYRSPVSGPEHIPQVFNTHHFAVSNIENIWWLTYPHYETAYSPALVQIQ